jgi:hypothetical protein
MADRNTITMPSLYVFPIEDRVYGSIQYQMLVQESKFPGTYLSKYKQYLVHKTIQKLVEKGLHYCGIRADSGETPIVGYGGNGEFLTLENGNVIQHFKDGSFLLADTIHPQHEHTTLFNKYSVRYVP